jgi:flavodoxin
MRVLIAYFSRKGRNHGGGGTANPSVGNTEAAAGMIQKLTAAWLRTSVVIP